MLWYFYPGHGGFVYAFNIVRVTPLRLSLPTRNMATFDIYTSLFKALRCNTGAWPVQKK